MEAESEDLGYLRNCGFENNRLGTSVARKSASSLQSHATRAVTENESKTVLKDTAKSYLTSEKSIIRIELDQNLTNYDPSLDLSLQEDVSIEAVLKGGVINKILGYHRPISFQLTASGEENEYSDTRYNSEEPNPDIEFVQQISEGVLYEISQMENLKDLCFT